MDGDAATVTTAMEDVKIEEQTTATAGAPAEISKNAQEKAAKAEEAGCEEEDC